MRLKDIKERIHNDLAEKIKEREKCRGSGVYLSESIGYYYMQVGEIFALQKLCEYLGIKTDLVYYDPFETEERMLFADKQSFCDFNKIEQIISEVENE